MNFEQLYEILDRDEFPEVSSGSEMKVFHTPSIPFVIKVPHIEAGYSTLDGYKIAKSRLGGLTPEFTILDDIKINGNNFPFAIFQKKVTPLDFYLETDAKDKVSRIEELFMMEREILARGILCPDNFFKNSGIDSIVKLIDPGLVSDDIDKIHRRGNEFYLPNGFSTMDHYLLERGFIINYRGFELTLEEKDMPIHDIYMESFGLGIKPIHFAFTIDDVMDFIEPVESYISNCGPMVKDIYEGARDKSRGLSKLLQLFDNFSADIINIVGRAKFKDEHIAIATRELERYYSNKPGIGVEEMIIE
jgi:hypothetical protein